MTKPKKSSANTFVSVFRALSKDNDSATKVTIPITGHGISIKGDGDFSTVIIKCTPLNPLLHDVRHHLCNLVCNESPKWFGKEMSPDVVDEYYTDPLMYDKRFGNIIRLKCNYDPDFEKINNKPFNAMLHFERLRFYKCKFVMEFSLHEIRVLEKTLPINDIVPDSEQEPCPFIEDANTTKINLVNSARDLLKKLSMSRDMLLTGITSLESQKDPRNILIESQKLEDIIRNIHE